MIFLQGKPVFYIFLPSTPPYWQIIFRFCWQWTPKWQQSESRSRATYFRLSVVLWFYHCLTKYIWEVHILAPCNLNFEFLVFIYDKTRERGIKKNRNKSLCYILDIFLTHVPSVVWGWAPLPDFTWCRANPITSISINIMPLWGA